MGPSSLSVGGKTEVLTGIWEKNTRLPLREGGRGHQMPFVDFPQVL